jgi:hypothetical protein
LLSRNSATRVCMRHTWSSEVALRSIAANRLPKLKASAVTYLSPHDVSGDAYASPGGKSGACQSGRLATFLRKNLIALFALRLESLRASPRYSVRSNNAARFRISRSALDTAPSLDHLFQSRSDRAASFVMALRASILLREIR